MKKKLKIAHIFILMIIIIFSNFVISNADSKEPDILAESAVLIDYEHEKVLYSKNPEKRMYPASTTKILTAILTIENCDLNEEVLVEYDAISTIPAGYSVAALQPGEKLTVKQLLEVMLVHSANDAANVLAFHISGSIDEFAKKMNEKVEELGLTNTHFTNPSGKHDDNHYTTATDLAKIMKYCMNNATFKKIAGQKNCTIPATNKYEQRIFNTTNELLIYDSRDIKSNYYYQYAIAGKTGYTTEAKNCLVSVSEKDDLKLICVVLGDGIYPDNISAKFVDTKSIFEYGYNNYILKKVREKDAIATQIDISNGSKETKNLNLIISQDIVALVPQNELDKEFEPEIELQNNLYAPIAQGQIVGQIKYKINNEEYKADLIAEHNVDRSSFWIITIQIILIIIILFFLYKLMFSSKSKKNGRKRKRTKRARMY